MSNQDFTDDCFAGGHVAQVDMANGEKNFAILKSLFFGPNPPPNQVPGMPWLDSTSHILTIKNEANTAWISIWNMATSKPILTSLSGDITEAMLASAILGPAASQFGLRKLGTGALEACAGNDSRLIPTVLDNAVSQSKLKSTTGSASCTISNPSGSSRVNTGALPGGSYGFRLQYYMSPSRGSFEGYYGVSSGSYVSPSAQFFSEVTGITYCYAQERYVQSSGEVHWVFLLRNRETGIIEKSWQCPDHPCFGNGDDPDLFQHPYGDYDQDKYELIVSNPPKNFVQELNKKAGKTKDLLEIIGKEYVIDDLSSPAWPSEKVTIGLPERWEDAWKTGEMVKPLKAVIPKPKNAITRVLKLK